MTLQVPCGSIQGFGEYCTHGRLCEVCEELLRCNANVEIIPEPKKMTEDERADEIYKKHGIAGLLGYGAAKMADWTPIEYDKYKGKL